MDPVETVLTAMKIENSKYLRVVARTPWAISFRARETARLVMIASGGCLLVSEIEQRRLAAGDCFIVRAGTGFTLTDASTDHAIDCEELFAKAAGATASYGGDGDATEIVSGRFSFDAAAAEPLFATLPPLVHLNPDDPSNRLLKATFDLLAREETQDGIGASLVTSRLADVLFVQAIRAFCATAQHGIGWIAAMRDPQLAMALRALHEDIARPWTVASLARAAGMSRSAFAAAFKAKVGDTPLGYLTSWRLYRAKALLRDTSMSLDQIAAQVGYESNTALSRAFARSEGSAPGMWRRRVRENPSAERPAGGVPA